MASNSLRSNLHNQAIGTAVIIKGHLERGITAVWEAWQCAVTGLWSTGIDRLTAWVPASDPNPMGRLCSPLTCCFNNAISSAAFNTLGTVSSQRGRENRSWKYPFRTSEYLIRTDIFSKQLSVKSKSCGTPLMIWEFASPWKVTAANENLGCSTRQA